MNSKAHTVGNLTSAQVIPIIRVVRPLTKIDGFRDVSNVRIERAAARRCHRRYQRESPLFSPLQRIQFEITDAHRSTSHIGALHCTAQAEINGESPV